MPWAPAATPRAASAACVRKGSPSPPPEGAAKVTASSTLGLHPGCDGAYAVKILREEVVEGVHSLEV